MLNITLTCIKQVYFPRVNVNPEHPVANSIITQHQRQPHITEADDAHNRFLSFEFSYRSLFISTHKFCSLSF